MPNPFEAMMEASAKMSITMAAKVTGMTPEQVAGILADAMPKAMEAAKASPETAAALFKQSFEAMPEPLQAVYEKMGAAATSAGAGPDDFVKMFGASASALQETAASMAGTTSDKAGAVFGSTVPMMKDLMRQGAAAAGQAADAVDPGKAQEMVGQMAEATASVFGKLAGR